MFIELLAWFGDKGVHIVTKCANICDNRPNNYLLLAIIFHFKDRIANFTF